MYHPCGSQDLKRKGIMSLPKRQVDSSPVDRALVWTSGGFDSIEVATTGSGPYLATPLKEDSTGTGVTSDTATTAPIWTRAASAPAEIVGAKLEREHTSVGGERQLFPRGSVAVYGVKGTTQVQKNDSKDELPTLDSRHLASTKELGIKQEVDVFQGQVLPLASSTAEGTAQERARVLASRIRRSIEKRKEHHANIETLRKRIRQSQLTYADLMRKRNRLENSLADLKLKLDSDERLLEAEVRSVDNIPTELEQASAELAAMISG